jgi:hypothetical protein
MFIHEVPLRDVKFGVWCAMSATRIIGPVFIPRPQIHMDMLHIFWHHFLKTCPITRETVALLSKRVNHITE